jgi:hypothetical protein
MWKPLKAKCHLSPALSPNFIGGEGDRSACVIVRVMYCESVAASQRAMKSKAP